MVIWKFDLAITSFQSISMPAGATLLSVANQRERLCLWAMVDEEGSDGAMEVRRFEIIGTGRPFKEDRRKYLGTVLIEPFVWHVFEVKP